MSLEKSRKGRGSRIYSMNLKLNDAEVKKIRRRLQAGARRKELADAYGVNPKTIQRRLDALKLAEAEPGLTSELEGKPERAAGQAPSTASSAARSRPPASASVGGGGVPLFPDTAEGRAARLAYYQARKLDRLPDSLHDYIDVLLGRETPAERRAREGRTGRR
jgi:hypothetical protein